MAVPAGRIAAPSGPSKPVAPKGYTSVGTGRGNWVFQKAGPARPTARQAANPLLNPNQTLSGNALLQAAQGLANAQTQGPLAELQKQIAANNAQTQGTAKLTGGFYNQLEPYVQQGVTNSGNIASGLNSQLQGIGNDTQTQLAGQGQNALSSLMKYAPQGEGGIANAATSDLAAQIARQQGLAAQQAGTYRSLGANQGANYQQMTNSQLGTYGLQGQEALKNIAQSGTVKNEPLVSKIAALQAQKGALTATDLGKLRQQEVANQISRAGLGIKQQSLNVTAQNNAANQKLKAQGQSITQQNDRANQALRAAGIQVTAANNNARNQNAANANQIRANYDQGTLALRSAALAIKNSGGGAVKPLTTAQNNMVNASLGRIIGLIREGQGAKQTEQQIRSHLQTGLNPSKKSYSPVLIQAAYELLGYGSIDRSTAAQLHNMGVRGTTYNNRPVKVTANYQPPPNYSGAQYNSAPPVSAGNAQVPGF